MKRILSRDPSGGMTVEATVQGGKPDLVLLPRTAFDVYIVDVPPIKGDNMETAIRARLRAVHPGSVDDADIDYRALAGDPGRCAVHVVRKSALAEAKPDGAAEAFTSSTRIMDAMKREGAPLSLWVSADWAELCEFADTGLKVSRVASRASRGLPETLGRLLKGKTAGAKIDCVFSVSADGDERAALDAIRGMGFDPAPMTVTEAISRCPRKELQLFRKVAGRAALAGSLAMKGMIAAMILLAAALPARLASYRSEELADLQKKHAALKESTSGLTDRFAELEALEAKYKELSSRRERRIYERVSDIALISGDRIRIRSLTIQGDDFRFEAEGRDALRVLSSLSRSGEFDSVDLQQSVPGAAAGERFSISGRWKHD